MLALDRFVFGCEEIGQATSCDTPAPSGQPEHGNSPDDRNTPNDRNTAPDDRKLCQGL